MGTCLQVYSFDVQKVLLVRPVLNKFWIFNRARGQCKKSFINALKDITATSDER